MTLMFKSRLWFSSDGVELMLRKTRKHEWIRMGVWWAQEFEPSKGWMYARLIHRWAVKLGPVGLYVLRMPRG